MSFLGRIPLWVWYLFSVGYLYTLQFGLWYLLWTDVALSTKVGAVIAALVVGALFVVEGVKAFNAFGLALFIAVIAAASWAAFDHGFRFGYLHYWWQWVGALFLTIAIRWGQVYRVMTGRVPVDPASPAHAGISDHDVTHHNN